MSSDANGTGPAESLVTFDQQPERPQQAIETAAFHEWFAPTGAVWTRFYRFPGCYLLRFPDLADFEVSANGAQVRAWAAPGVESSTVAHLYANQVLPLAMSRQNKLVLHGSAVETGDRCVAFVGASGRGKSTLAASFALQGCRFLTDDGLHLEWAGEQLMVNPGHSSVRLWQDSEAALAVGRAAAPALKFTSKNRFPAGPELAYCSEPRPLHRVYFLGERQVASPTIETAQSAATLIALVRNSFLLDIDGLDMLARHFDEISKIAALPIHFTFEYPRRYEDLPFVREAIVRHTKQLH